jgi:hypothetical protein
MCPRAKKQIGGQGRARRLTAITLRVRLRFLLCAHPRPYVCTTASTLAVNSRCAARQPGAGVGVTSTARAHTSRGTGGRLDGGCVYMAQRIIVMKIRPDNLVDAQHDNLVMERTLSSPLVDLGGHITGSALFGWQGRDRTCDIGINSAMLYRLSYSPSLSGAGSRHRTHDLLVTSELLCQRSYPG